VRLAFLTPELLPQIGGMGIYAINLIKELCKRQDMDIHVFTPSRGKDYQPEKVLAYFGHRIKLHNISKARDDFVYNFAFQYKVFRELPRYHSLYNYDLIHIANLVNMPDIFLKFKPLDIPVVTTVHSTIKGQVRGFLDANRNFLSLAASERWSLALYPYISLMEKIYLRQTRYLITVSFNLADLLRTQYHYQGMIQPILNGVDLELFNHEKVDDPYDRFPQLKGRGPIVLYVGRLVARKGLNLFVEAITKLRDTSAHFVFVGNGSEELLFQLLRQYNIPEEKYTYLGFIPNHDLPALYKLSSIFVLPSYYENIPFVLLEAMAMKLPCIASNVGGVPEIINHGDNGLLFEAGDIHSLITRIRFLLGNEEQRSRIAENGFRRVNVDFPSVIMAEKHLLLYQNVLNAHKNLR
jgi:glycosyltransferase involved in cell wall biosynthesis